MMMGSLLDHAILAKRTSEQANIFALEDAGNITYVTYVFRHWILETKGARTHSTLGLIG